MSKGYEILYIIKTGFSEEERKNISEKVTSFITEKGGHILSNKELGLKDFAMELKKQKQGYYYQTQFVANNDQLEHLQQELKVTETIFRYLIVTLDSVLTEEEYNQKLSTVS